MKDVEIFSFDKKEVRTAMIDGDVWFVAKDVAELLGYKDTVNAVKQHCKGVVKHHPLQTPGGVQEARIINEPDLYRLIANSNMPAAVKFEQWIYQEVLPTIRKTGGAYLTQSKAEELLANPDLIIALATEVKELRFTTTAQQAQIEADRPKVEFAETVQKIDKGIPLGDFAKVVSQRGGFIIGRNNLFRWMRSQKIIDRNNMPNQRYIDNGWLVVEEGHYESKRYSGPVAYFKTLCTGVGQVGILARMKADPELYKYLGRDAAALRTNRAHYPVTAPPEVQ